MGTVYLCDRCGRQIAPHGIINLMKCKTYFTKIDYIPSKMNKTDWTVGKSMILCDKCGLDFSRWWSE